ncbi:MAG: hypothetical protein IKB88_02105 [Clostridia bacterium]|nr:hypothetical protein [Clostridia bacterium]
MPFEKTCETCRFQSKDNPFVCLAEACYSGDMWEPEETQNAENVQSPSVFSKSDCEIIYNDFMKGVE